MLNAEFLPTEFESDFGADDRDTDSSYVPSAESPSSSEGDEEFTETKSPTKSNAVCKELVKFGGRSSTKVIPKRTNQLARVTDWHQQNEDVHSADEIAEFPKIISVRGNCESHFENDTLAQTVDIPQILSTATDKVLRLYSKWELLENHFVCNVCDKLFKCERTVKRHMRTHLSFKEFECSVCGKMFRRKCQLTVHERIHSKEKPHKCDICGRAFREKGQLRNHAKVHTGEKRHICEICDRPFASKKLLERHQLCHMKAKPFSCKFCDKKFSRKWSMLDHVKRHLSVPKNFECCFCGKAFSQNSQLTKHMVVHTGESEHYCDICDIQFHWSGSLYRHMKRTHSVNWSQGEITDNWPRPSKRNSTSNRTTSLPGSHEQEEGDEQEGTVNLLGVTSSESGQDQSV